MPETTELPSLRLVALDFAEDINRLTDEFVGREWIFTEIAQWIRAGNEPFFILTGEPGIGKSAIAARLTQVRDDIAAYHFCIAGRNSTIVPGTVLRSIAAQLGRKLLDYGLTLANTIKPTYLSVNVKIDVGTMSGGQITGVVINNLTITDAKQEIETLLTAPLSAMPAPAQPVLILLDSLDEAFNYSPNENLVTLLAGLHNLPRWVRIILTSRPEARVLSYFGFLPTHVVAAESQMNREDLRRYVGYRISKSKLFTRLQAAPTPITAEALVEKVAGVSEASGLADGNFLYTKILLNDIESGVQPLGDLAALPKSLDDIYQGFLLRLAPEWETKYQPLLAVLAVAREPLTREQLLRFGDQSARLIGGRMSATLVNLALGVLVQFLDMRGAPASEIYSLFHQSLRDYLGETSRSGRFACPPEDGHGAIADYYWQATFDQAAGRHNWNTCDTYGLAHLPAHLAGANLNEDLHDLLTDFEFLKDKTTTFGIVALLTDFQAALEITRSEPWSDENREDLLRLYRVLLLSSTALTRDPGQLSGQLIGRLSAPWSPHLTVILQAAEAWAERPWLCPTRVSLATPGGSLIRTLPHPGRGINVLALSGSGQVALVGSRDGIISVWNLEGGEPRIAGPGSGVWHAALSSDGSRAVWARADRIEVWDHVTLVAPRILIQNVGGFGGLAVDPAGSKATFAHPGSWDLQHGYIHTGGSVLVWDFEQDTYEIYQDEPSTPILALAPDGRHAILLSSRSRENPDILCTMSFDGLGVFDALSPNNVFRCWHLHGSPLEQCQYGDEEFGAAADVTRGPVRIWMAWHDQVKPLDLNPIFGQDEKPMLKTERTTCVALSGKGDAAAFGMLDGKIKVRRFMAEAEFRTVAEHGDRVVAVAVSDGGRSVLSASANDSVKVWEVKVEGGAQANMGPLACAALTPDGRWLIASSDRLGVVVVDLTGAVDTRVFSDTQVTCVAITPDGRWALWGSMITGVHICDLSLMNEPLVREMNLPSAAAITPDGRRVICGSVDGTVRLWDLTPLAHSIPLSGTSGWVSTVALSVDGRFAISGTRDEGVRIWSLDSDSAPRTATEVRSWVSGITVTQDSRLLVGYRDGTLHVLDLQGTEDGSHALDLGSPICNMSISWDGEWAAFAFEDGTVEIRCLRSNEAARLTFDSPILACTVSAETDPVVICVERSGATHKLHMKGVASFLAR
jgi:WD40 repeat protein